MTLSHTTGGSQWQTVANCRRRGTQLSALPSEEDVLCLELDTPELPEGRG